MSTLKKPRSAATYRAARRNAVRTARAAYLAAKQGRVTAMHPAAQTPGFYLGEIAGNIAFGVFVGCIILLCVGLS